jgi:cell division protein FtsA
MTLLSGRHKGDARRSGLITVLDVGSTKVCCIIARLKPVAESGHLPGRTHQARVIGIGHQRSRGVKSGVIIELDRAEQAIRLAVDAAERMAGLTIESLLVSVAAGRLRSQTLSARVDLGGHTVEAADIKRVLGEGARHVLRAERQVVHALPVGFALDGEHGVRDPRGMVGDMLGVDMHVLTGDAAPLRNLELAINRAHLSVERMVAAPYASALAALVDDEAELGAACVDMGGGTTSIAIFQDGKFVHAEILPLGGGHVTLDLARGLSISLEDAERLKVMHGTVLQVISDSRDVLSITPIGAEETEQPLQVPRAAMSRIIRARVDEILEMTRDRLSAAGFSGAGRRVVLTGGASQLAGMADAARRILARNVRLGRPMGIAGLPEAAKGPAFSTAVGLTVYPQVEGPELRSTGGVMGLGLTGTGGRLQRMGQWFRDNF